MKYILILLIFTACQSERKPDDPAIWLSPDSTKVIKNSVILDSLPMAQGNFTISKGLDSGIGHGVIYSLGGYYCCDTIRTTNHRAIVKSVLDTNGVLTGFEIVKVLK